MVTGHASTLVDRTTAGVTLVLGLIAAGFARVR